MKRLISITLALAMMLVVTACGGTSGQVSETSVTEATSSNTPVTTDGEQSESVRDDINVQLSGDPGTLDPFYLTGTGGFVVVRDALYDPLWCFDTDGEIRYMLAESSEWKSDTELVINLRKDVAFSNGEAFKANDVLFTIGLTAESKNAIYVNSIDIASSYAEDDYTLCLVMNAPTATQFYNLCLVPMLDEESYDAETIATQPIGTGPYVLEEYLVNSYVKLTAKEDYWGGAAQIKNVNLKVITEDSVKLSALETGEVDCLYDVPTSDVEYIKSMDNMTVVEKGTGLITIAMFNNTEDSLMASKEARYAVGYAIDKDAVCNIAYNGFAIPATCAFSQSYSDYEERFATANDLYVTGYNLEKAKEYAEKAGLVGNKVRIITMNQTPLQLTCELIQGALGEIGVEAVIDSYETAAINDICKDLTAWDIVVKFTVSPSSMIVDSMNAIVAYQSFGSWPNCDDYLNKAAANLANVDDSTRSDAVFELLTYYEDECHHIGIADQSSVYCCTSECEGFAVGNAGSPFRIGDWYWTE